MNFNICRLCNVREASINIFKALHDRLKLSAKIMYCCGSLNVIENDGLPEHICCFCERELDACYQFVLKCQASDEKLRASLLNLVPSEKAEWSPKTEVKTELECLGDDQNDADKDFTYQLHEFKHDVKSESKKEPSSLASKRCYKRRIKANKEELMCSDCGRICSSASALAVHSRAHTDERPFQCTSCDKKYKDRGTLTRHINRNHVQKRERKFICENCGKGFYSKSDIQIHMRVHTGETPYNCPICAARFTQLSAMLRHKRRHTEAKTHMCSTCGKPFWTKEELKKHFSVHDDVRNFSCNICNVQFKHKSGIQKHMRTHLEPNRFVCNHCGKTFNTKGNLKSHMDRKHSEKSGYCNICSKNVSNIEVHMWRHTGQRPLKCEFCTKSFYEMKALALHINFKHKKTDRFKCSIEGCTKSFPSKPMLEFHIAKFHEMQTPYPCDKCSRGFYRKNDLARHKIGTHKERLI